MELLQAIALLCQVSATGSQYTGDITKLSDTFKYQTRCQQSYLNCVSVKRSRLPEKEALERCILEK